jgi:hypothetical protein
MATRLGGVRETEVTAVAVMPNRRPFHAVDSKVTVEASRRMVDRKSSTTWSAS